MNESYLNFVPIFRAYNSVEFDYTQISKKQIKPKGNKTREELKKWIQYLLNQHHRKKRQTPNYLNI